MSDRRCRAGGFQLDARGEVRRAFLTRIASLLPHLPAGHGFLVEATADGLPLSVIASSGLADASLRSLARESSGALLRQSPRTAPTALRPGWHERWGVLVHRPDPPRRPTIGTDEPADAPVRPVDRPAPRLDVDLPGGVWLGIQSYWISRGSSEIAYPTRLRLSAPPGEISSAVIRTTGAILSRLGPGFDVEWAGLDDRRRRLWREGRLRRWDGWRPPHGTPDGLVPLFELRIPRPFPDREALDHHLVLLGASGAGKTTLLVRLAADAIRRREPVALFDLHGDLAPSVLAQLPGSSRQRVLAIDPSVDDGTGPGIAVLGAGDRSERSVAHVVAALKRLSTDGTDIYWGFRLERIFDTLVRLAQEEEGTLLDVYDLLTNPDRREASRLSTRLPAAERFLAELPPLLKRNPEYLGPATARLARVALSPRLAQLLAPSPATSIPLDPLFDGSRPLLLRIPLAEIGPEASGFAATLVLTRLYLEAARRERSRPILFVLDEAQAFSPRLLTEILSEGRKFRVRAAIASQYADRLAPELRDAAAGAAGTHLVFRLPPPAARRASPWAGLPESEAGSVLPTLRDGWARVSSLADGAPRFWRSAPSRAPLGTGAWSDQVRATRREFGSTGPEDRSGAWDADARLLLGLAGERSPVSVGALLDRLGRTNGAPPPGFLERVDALERRGLLLRGASGISLTAAGSRRLGASSEHGATRESGEHRQLLLGAFRIFAGRGERIDILPQGRYDTRLPDAVLRLLGERLTSLPPGELERRVVERRRSWAWRYSGGRDIYLEAEVSGAERPDRIRHGLAKAARAGAFALFLVADARRGRRVREVLLRSGAARGSWAVWTLPLARIRHGLDG
ncbi:MAG TPA: hypothetical protein VEY07_07635 [Thermoplasmata archaeon]|nr:hypothetical protein [Thermoplasmata archaeon]